MEQEVSGSNRHWTVAGLSVCSLLPLVDEIPVSCVAKHEIDERPAHDHKTGERLTPHLVNVGRRTQCEAMARHQLFERALIRLPRGKKVRCEWLDEMKQGPDGPSCAAGSLQWKWPTGSDHILSQAQHLANASRSSSRWLRRQTHSRARSPRHQRCFLARAATSRRANRDLSATLHVASEASDV